MKRFLATSPEALSDSPKQDDWIVQPWLEGQAASMALVVRSGVVRCLGSVEQCIRIEPLATDAEIGIVEYAGGFTPVNTLSMDVLEHVANQVLEALPDGASGWIGIDFLMPNAALNASLRPDDLVVIEINPRLTTSYLGHRERYGKQIAEMLLDTLLPRQAK